MTRQQAKWKGALRPQFLLPEPALLPSPVEADAESYVSNKRHRFALPNDQSQTPKLGIRGSPNLAISSLPY